MTWYVQENRLLDFLHKISTDEELTKAYKENPEAVINEYGLSAEDKEALLSEDIHIITTAFTNQLRRTDAPAKGNY